MIDDYYCCYIWIYYQYHCYLFKNPFRFLNRLCMKKQENTNWGLKQCLLFFFCTGYQKSSTVGIGVRDNFATILELPAVSSRKRIEEEQTGPPAATSAEREWHSKESVDSVTSVDIGRTGSLYQPSWRGRGGGPGLFWLYLRGKRIGQDRNRSLQNPER